MVILTLVSIEFNWTRLSNCLFISFLSLTWIMLRSYLLLISSSNLVATSFKLCRLVVLTFYNLLCFTHIEAQEIEPSKLTYVSTHAYKLRPILQGCRFPLCISTSIWNGEIFNGNIRVQHVNFHDDFLIVTKEGQSCDSGARELAWIVFLLIFGNPAVID